MSEVSASHSAGKAGVVPVVVETPTATDTYGETGLGLPGRNARSRPPAVPVCVTAHVPSTPAIPAPGIAGMSRLTAVLVDAGGSATVGVARVGVARAGVARAGVARAGVLAGIATATRIAVMPAALTIVARS